MSEHEHEDEAPEVEEAPKGKQFGVTDDKQAHQAESKDAR